MIRTGHEDEAAGWFYSALKEDSAYAQAHNGLAEYFSRRGQSRRAQLHETLQPSFLAAIAESFFLGRSSITRPRSIYAPNYRRHF